MKVAIRAVALGDHLDEGLEQRRLVGGRERAVEVQSPPRSRRARFLVQPFDTEVHRLARREQVPIEIRRRRVRMTE